MLNSPKPNKLSFFLFKKKKKKELLSYCINSSLGYVLKVWSTCALHLWDVWGGDEGTIVQVVMV